MNDFLNTPINDIPLTHKPLAKPVPNKHPRIPPTGYRLAIIGEAPGQHEERAGVPFIGPSGKLLTSLLCKAGVIRDQCFVGNICQLRPPNNDIEAFSLEGDEIADGLEQLAKDLDIFKPHCCLLLGKTALWAAKGETKIGNWRGSLFHGEKAPFLHRKCIAAYHPAACLRQFSWVPILAFDCRKAAAEARTAELVIPERRLHVDLSLDEILDSLAGLNTAKKVALDIEGGIGTMSCISFAPSDSEAFIVPLANLNGSSYWSTDEEELRIWQALVAVLESPTIPKVLQNSLYDRFVIQYSYGICCRNIVDDTMLKHWELYSELEKGLGFQASIYTNEPFYKSERKTDDRSTFYRYCCKDSALTWEINDKLENMLPPPAKAHYDLNVGLLNPILYMELTGIRYDSKLAKQRLKEVNEYIWNLQAELDEMADCYGDDKDLTSLIPSVMCYKKNPSQPKKTFEDDYYTIQPYLQSKQPLTKAQRAHIATALKVGMNIRSPEFKTYLYETLKLPKQFKTDPKTKAKRLSTDYEALLIIQKNSPHKAVGLAIEIGSLRTRAQMLEIHADKDGRVRCGYNIVGTETGRLTSYTSPTGSGYNLQTIPDANPLKPEGHPLRNGMRDLFTANDDFWLFQCDLKGADGWTIGAHLKTLGDSTMFNDLKGGVKPASAICYMLRHGNNSLDGVSREEVRELIKEIKKSDWDYFACKVGIWGTCYLMGPNLLASQIAQESEGKVWLSRSQVQEFQAAVYKRYKLILWHNWMKQQLAKSGFPSLTSASGHTRRFFGRAEDVLGEALADEPQENTTYATNLAAYRLWTDKENRITTTDSKWDNPFLQREGQEATQISRVALRIQPLHQVHDALVGQFRKSDTTWAIDKLKSYFDNEITIAGIKMTIPFDGQYGPSWGQLGSEYGGGTI